MENRGPHIVAVFTTFLVLAWLSVGLRCYVRLKVVRRFALDDWLAVATLLFFTVFCALALNSVRHGGGQHHYNLTKLQIREGMKSWYFANLFYVMNTTFLRLALSIFLLRVAIKKLHRGIIYSLIAFQLVFNLFYIFLSIFTCNPPSYFWDHNIGGKGKCINVKIHEVVAYTQASMAAFTDWSLALLPIAILWDLQIKRQKKVAVGILLSFGAFASTAAVVRIPYIDKVRNIPDFLYATADLAIWSAVEPGLGLTAVSLAACRPLLDRRYGGTYPSRTGGTYPSRAGPRATPLPPSASLSGGGGGGTASQRDAEWGAFDFSMQPVKGGGPEKRTGSGSSVGILTPGADEGRF